ncbi:MAG: GNAT family N-acetyltransferase [Oscillospiraceae bacterium]|nr:GNAT family N-acetyltransferase [Oscillospiraceae bacterium]
MLTLYRPKLEDMWFRRQMLEDEETMSYNHAWGGTVHFPEERWKDWYEYWVGEPAGERYYRYLRNEEGDFIGEIAYHLDAGTGYWLADVIVFSLYRHRGYGGEALDLLCAEACANGVDMLWDDIAADNPAVGMFLRHGFAEDHRTDELIFLKKRLN